MPRIGLVAGCGGGRSVIGHMRDSWTRGVNVGGVMRRGDEGCARGVGGKAVQRVSL